MVLIDQWHLSDGIRCCDVVRCSSHPWWWSSPHPQTWCNHPWIWSTVGGDVFCPVIIYGEFLDGSDVLIFVSGQCWHITSNYLEEIYCRCNGEVMLQRNWDLAVSWVQAPGVGEAEMACCRNVESKALVVVGGGSDVETIGCMWHPGCSGSWIIV
jgi:hypothetical protein